MLDLAVDAVVPQWFNERQVAELSGLPGPLIAELLPRLPTVEAYCVRAELYDADSVYKARIAALMMLCGIRMQYIRAAMAEPVARERMVLCYSRWRALAGQPNTQTPPRRIPVIFTAVVIPVIIAVACALVVLRWR